MKHTFVSGPPGTGNKLCAHVTPCGREGVEGDVHVAVDWREYLRHLALTARGGHWLALGPGCRVACPLCAAIAAADAALLSAGKAGG